MGVTPVKRLMLFALLVVFSFAWTVQGHADKLSEMNKQKKNIQNQISNISKNKKELEKTIKDKINAKETLLEQQKKTSKELKMLEEEVNTLEELIAALEADLEEAERKYEHQKQMFKTRIKVMYENSSITYLQTLIESKSIIDFFERLQLIALISKNDKQLVHDLDEAKKDVEYKRALTQNEKQQVEEKAKEKEKIIQEIKSSRAEVDREIKKYEMTLEELEKQEDELIKKSQELTKQINKLMSEGKYTGGIMKWPCPSSTKITSEYGMRYHPILKKNKLHTGIDIGASRGASIVAAAKGKVILAEWQTGYGNTVIIDHGGKIATLYAHCDKILVEVGDTVEAGKTIAKVGSTGWSTGPHLHFEVIVDGKTQNPLNYLGKKK